MNKLKNWLRGAVVAVGAAIGFHAVQKPTLDVRKPVAVVARATPTHATTSPQPPGMGTPHIDLGELHSTPDEKAMVMKGLEYANTVLASDCFKQAVLKSNFTENNDLKPDQIYALLSKYRMTANIELYDGSYKENYVWLTIGYENDPFDGWTYMNRFFVTNAFMVASNVIHEVEGHAQGFHHYEVMDTSEPYGMNGIFEQCAPVLGITDPDE